MDLLEEKVNININEDIEKVDATQSINTKIEIFDAMMRVAKLNKSREQTHQKINLLKTKLDRMTGIGLSSRCVKWSQHTSTIKHAERLLEFFQFDALFNFLIKNMHHNVAWAWVVQTKVNDRDRDYLKDTHIMFKLIHTLRNVGELSVDCFCINTKYNQTFFNSVNKLGITTEMNNMIIHTPGGGSKTTYEKYEEIVSKLKTIATSAQQDLINTVSSVFEDLVHDKTNVELDLDKLRSTMKILDSEIGLLKQKINDLMSDCDISGVDTLEALFEDI